MTLDLFYKLSTIIIPLATAWVAFKNLSFTSSSKQKDEYRFAKDFIEDITRTPNQHPLVIDRGFRAIAGSTKLSANEAAYIINQKDSPERALQNYIFSHEYLKFYENEQSSKIDYRPCYQNKYKRMGLKVLHWITYIVFSYFALSPLLLIPISKMDFEKITLPLIFTLTVGGSFAVYSLLSLVKLSLAKKLIAKFSTNIDELPEG
ncbi:hypothetical protein [Pseudomonas sp. RL_15y_Pfl2_60]|uniref:hypothetical protein n=1 Tax=Pseudomonas sp. RL_15y_Pfl2_60 TaxID=3088709 RepID=UPI0030D8FAA3